MTIQSLKQRLSIRNISQSFLRVVRRFPVATVLLTALTALLSYMVVSDSENGRVVSFLLSFLCVGTVISLATSLWGEEQANPRLKRIVESVSLTVCGVYCALLFLFDIIPNSGLPSFYIGHTAWIVLIVLLVPFGSFLREQDDLKVWHFIMSLCVALLISSVATWVLSGGIEGLVFGTAALFDFHVPDNLPLVIMIVCGVLLFGMLFLALIPYDERKHNASDTMPSFLIKIVSWLLLPLLGCYILVLYVYGITILVNWELPKGMISWLVSAVMGVYMLCYILLYPQVTHRDSWQSKVLTHLLPIVILPLLVLMSVGVVRRFTDYGITAPRLYLLTLLIWFYAVCIAMLVVPRKRFRRIVFSFAALFILSSGHPLNYYRLCRPYLSAKIDKMIAEKGLQLPLDWYALCYTSNPDDELHQLDTELAYMKDCYGRDYVSRWVGESERFSKDAIKGKREELWAISYTKRPGENLSPQGYTTFRWVNNDSDELPSQLTEDSIVNGILHVPYEDAVLLFDTAAIRLAEQNNELLIVPSSNGKVAYSAQNISVTAYTDRTIDIQYSGYMFAKE